MTSDAALDDPIPANGSGPDSTIDSRLLVAVARRLAADFPTIPPTQIEALLDEHLAATRTARVKTFRLVLAEKETRGDLRALGATGAAHPR